MLPIPDAIMKAVGHTEIKTTMIYVSLGKSHIREQVEKLNAISVLLPSPTQSSGSPAVGDIASVFVDWERFPPPLPFSSLHEARSPRQGVHRSLMAKQTPKKRLKSFL